MKLTPWFPPEIKPVHIGFYERKTQRFSLCRGKWNGKEWRFKNSITGWQSAAFQHVYWRGLAKKP